MYRIYKAELEENQRMASGGKYRRVLLLSTDGGLHSNFAFKYYCENVYKKDDFMILLYCPKILGVENVQTDESMKKDVVATKLGQLVLEENQRFMNDAKKLESQLKEKKLDGEVQIGVAGVPPGETIVETSKKEKVHMIILGARRLGTALREAGSTKKFVIRNAKVPVLVCKHGKYEAVKKKPREGVKRLIVAGSDGEMHASDALKFYRDHLYRDGDFILIAYIPVPRLTTSKLQQKALMDKSSSDLEREAQELYADDAKLLNEFIKDDLKMPGDVIVGIPGAVAGDAIIDVAKREGADLIVVGSRGLGLQAYETGSRTTDIVVNDSEVSVFVNKC